MNRLGRNLTLCRRHADILAEKLIVFRSILEDVGYGFADLLEGENT